LAYTLILHSCYSPKFSCSRVHFASVSVAATIDASTAPPTISLLFRSLHRESIHTEQDSFIHASILFRCHSCRRSLAANVAATLPPLPPQLRSRSRSRLVLYF